MSSDVPKVCTIHPGFLLTDLSIFCHKTRNIRIVLGVCCTQLMNPKSRSRFIRFIIVDDDRTPHISQSSLTVGEYPLFSMNVLMLHRTSFCFADKERLGSNLEALASLFKPNSPKQAHSGSLDP